MQEFKLFMMLLGCKPRGRHTEQHDMFFTIAGELRDCVPDILAFWPGAGKIHIDAWRNVSFVNGYRLRIMETREKEATASAIKLFFINLGGYKAGEFEEYHYKMVVAAENREAAVRQAKLTAFFKHNQLSHVDDKYGIDVDDIYNIEDILPASVKERYSILLEPVDPGEQEDEIHLGYFKLDKL
ncbi:MAG: DUF1543 domain-containing protein [Citrobacter freundii]|nr:MAG: DUF1543 domain-containing protein [Citrobacter freundii]